MKTEAVRRAIALFISVGLAAAPAHATAPSAASGLEPAPFELRGEIERFNVDRGALRRSHPVESSPARDARFLRFYEDALADLSKVDFDALSHDGRVDYVLFRNHLESEILELEIRAKAVAEAAPLVPFAATITELAEARRRMEPIDAADAAARLTQLAKDVRAARSAVEERLAASRRDEGGKDGAPKKTVANRAASWTSELRSALRSWFSFYDGYDPVFTWWASEPHTAADQALQEYAAFLNEKVLGLAAAGDAADAPRPRGGGGGRSGGGGGSRTSASARPGDASDIIGDPIGRDALLVALRSEMIPYTPEELIAVAKRELAWCEDEMRKASREMGFGDDWRQALERVKTLHAEPGKQPELIKDLVLEAIAYLDEHDLVTIPPLARETWRMEMMSPERQLVSPFFLGGETIMVSFPTSTMSHEQKLMSLRGNNAHFSRATVHHEIIPGHHLQGFMTARHKPYRGLFATPFWGEGWALYWELLLWDRGFAKSPENKVGMLFWRMHRCARIIFSLGFHLETMTPQECIDLLVNGVGHEKDNATAEVRRSFEGSYGPLYQAAYLLGGMQFMALRRELVDTGKMTDRAFHDAILHENRIPVEMVRATLTKQPLTRDFKSTWRFLDEGVVVR